MLATLYPFIVAGVAFSILWWFYQTNTHKSKLLPNLSFFGSTILYAITLFLSDFSLYYKLLMFLPRDLVVFVVVFLLANNIKTNRAFFLSILGMGFAGYLLYSNFIPETYQYLSKNQENTSSIKTNPQELAKDGEFLFDIKDENLLKVVQAALEPYDVKIRKAFPNLQHDEYSALEEYYLLDIPDKTTYKVKKWMNLLYNTGAIDWVETNEVVKLDPVEGTQMPSSQPIDYGINDPNLDKMWGFEKMRVNEYFAYLRKKGIKPKKKAKIAILDTGVDSKHEDIQGNYVSTQKKYDSDKQSHGTHCAGIAASVSNNNIGVASLAINNKFVQVTSIKVLSDYGWGTQDDILRGIIEAADKGADVISMSLGGPARGNARRAYEEAFQYAKRAGAIVVVAAGNENDNAKNYVPASCKGVISVSAVDSNLDRASFSNYITEMEMGIAAPGVDILSTIPQGKYAAYSGTSMATPYVAGLLGIMKSLNPKLNTSEAYKILKATGFETKDTKATGKMINPLEAVKALQ